MGVWGSPQTVSGSAQGAAGTVAARFFSGERGAKTRKGF
ncbi:replication protein [Shigella flexneri 1235-66]|nr:replication protein [Shigella flexneri 1235-66]